MMRRKLVAGNWKMNGDLAALGELRAILAAAQAHSGVDVAIAVPATLIAPAVAAVPELQIGAQDVHSLAKGAHTGGISVAMIAEAGATFSIVGHSERRADNHETNAEVKAKAEALHAGGLQAILCVGETLADHDAGRAESVVTAQLAGSLPDGAHSDWLTVAYEPVWAVGTGRTPTVEDMSAMHGAIRRKLHDLIGSDSDAVRILYGGSVTGDNAAMLLAAADVDGALIGGASLTAAKFVPIIDAAAALG